MKVLFYSEGGIDIFPSNIKFDSSSSFFVQNEIDFLIGSVEELDPDIVFIGGFELNDDLLKTIENILIAKPTLEVSLCGNVINQDFLIQVMRLGVREIVNTISIENIQSVIQRSYLRHHVNNKLSVTENKVIGFMSAKGGDGGTCVASNVATALANLSKLKFLILDLSLPFGDIEMFLTNKKRIHDLSDFADEIERLDSPLMASMATHLSDNLDLIPSPESVDRLIRIKPEYIDRIIDIAKNSYDYVLVDIGAGIDPISIHALGKLDQLNVIATLSVPSFKRATQVITYCHELGFDRAKFKLIINRFEKSSDIGVDDFNKATGEKVSRILPQDNSGVKESLLKGIPLVNLKPNSDFTKAILDWSRDWLGLPHERSIWHRLRIK